MRITRHSLTGGRNGHAPLSGGPLLFLLRLISEMHRKGEVQLIDAGRFWQKIFAPTRPVQAIEADLTRVLIGLSA